MRYTAADLAMAEHHVALGERHVIHQEELISRLRARGLPTEKAEELLDEFRITLREHREHRDLMITSMGGEA